MLSKYLRQQSEKQTKRRDTGGDECGVRLMAVMMRCVVFVSLWFSDQRNNLLCEESIYVTLKIFSLTT